MDEAPGAAACTRRILVIDDEQTLRCVLQRYLGRLGWDVAEAGSGGEALTMLHDLAVPLDAVFVDLHLPDLSGTALCRRILDEFPALRGRILVATGDVESAEEALAGAELDCPVMGKPFDLPDLDRALADMLARLAASSPQS